jgi:hypothetical protein
VSIAWLNSPQAKGRTADEGTWGYLSTSCWKNTRCVGAGRYLGLQVQEEYRLAVLKREAVLRTSERVVAFSRCQSVADLVRSPAKIFFVALEDLNQ